MFAGGSNAGSYSNAIDRYNSSLTKATNSTLSVARDQMGAAQAGNNVIFAGGFRDSSNVSNVVDVFDDSGARKSGISGLSKARGKITAVTIDRFALFLGRAQVILRVGNTN